MRKLFSFGLILLLTLGVSDQVQAAVKAGAKCQKIASTQTVANVKFTCIKSGTKLIWNKGVTVTSISIPSPTPSATPAPVTQAKLNPFDSSPFPDEFVRAEMVEAVFKSFNEFIKRPPSVSTHKIVIDPKFQSDATAITKLVKDAYAVLPFPSGYPTTVIILSEDKELIEKTVKENGFGKGNYQESGYFCRNCAGYGWATSSNPLSSVTTHEMFHIWQRAAYKREDDNNPDPNNPLSSPVWFDEGGAEFFSEAFYSKISETYQVPKLRYEPLYLKDYVTRDKDRSLPYILGRLAGEYIVASKGMDKYLEIYWNVGKGQGFPAAFENALGISLDNFYEKFDKNLKNML
jgi:hypothetical protein